MQSVTELDDGSALFITVAKYLSPALHEIDQVGIQPDIQCSPDILSLPRAPSLRENSEATNLEMDSCIMVAEQALEIEQTRVLLLRCATYGLCILLHSTVDWIAYRRDL